MTVQYLKNLSFLCNLHIQIQLYSKNVQYILLPLRKCQGKSKSSNRHVCVASIVKSKTIFFKFKCLMLQEKLRLDESCELSISCETIAIFIQI